MTASRFILKKIRSGEEYQLTGLVPIGREVENGVTLVEEGASRRHASVSIINGTAYVEDMGSRNGTSINAERIKANTKTSLRPGDRIKFHTEEFELRVEGGDVTVLHASNETKAQPRSWAEVEFNTAGTDGTERFDANQLKEYLARRERQEIRTQINNKEPCLRIFKADKVGQMLTLSVDGTPLQEWTIGRTADAAVVLDDPSVSERHAKIVREGARWKLLDAISSNGSYVNDLQVGMCYLTSGDNLRFGRIQCVFSLPRRAQSLLKPGTGSSRKSLFLAGVGISFLITLVILLWVFRARLL